MSDSVQHCVEGAGLGLRRGMLPMLRDLRDTDVDFMEVAPENWIGVGGRFGRQFHDLTERFPFVCHGLSLSLGSPAPLDVEFVRSVRSFLDEFHIRSYSEHLSFCSDDKGHLYDLMPIPFTEEAAAYVSARIRQTQDILGRQIAIENVSYYAAPGQAMAEVDFINAVLADADCRLLVDVNNIYVNSVNFSYDPMEFLLGLDLQRFDSYLNDGANDDGAPIILWNHRWEYDKNPEEFFAALDRLERTGAPGQTHIVLHKSWFGSLVGGYTASDPK